MLSKFSLLTISKERLMRKFLLSALVFVGLSASATAEDPLCLAHNCPGSSQVMTSQQLNDLIQSYFGPSSGFGSGGCSLGFCQDNTDREACLRDCANQKFALENYCRNLIGTADEKARCWEDAYLANASCISFCNQGLWSSNTKLKLVSENEIRH